MFPGMKADFTTGGMRQNCLWSFYTQSNFSGNSWAPTYRMPSPRDHQNMNLRGDKLCSLTKVFQGNTKYIAKTDKCSLEQFVQVKAQYLISRTTTKKAMAQVKALIYLFLLVQFSFPLLYSALQVGVSLYNFFLYLLCY